MADTEYTREAFRERALRLWDSCKGYYSEYSNDTPDVLRAEFVKLLAALPSASLGEQLEPEGWKLVPLEPTLDMLDALNSYAQCEGFVHEGYRAMLAASPASKSAGGGGGGDGWCTHCGCGNDAAGYAHAPLCQRPARTGAADASTSHDQQENTK